MFTVKHSKANGEEFIVECASFFAERIDGTMDWRFTTYDTPYRQQGNQSGLWWGHPQTSSLDNDTIYVMNRFGKTVATYHYAAPEATGVMQADPDYVAAMRQAA